MIVENEDLDQTTKRVRVEDDSKDRSGELRIVVDLTVSDHLNQLKHLLGSASRTILLANRRNLMRLRRTIKQEQCRLMALDEKLQDLQFLCTEGMKLDRVPPSLLRDVASATAVVEQSMPQIAPIELSDNVLSQVDETNSLLRIELERGVNKKV